MGKDVNINSSEWRDLIFKGKNKAYGAYKLRATSSKRHIVAFIVTLCFVGVLGAIPYLIDAVKPAAQYLGGTDDQVKLADLEKEKEKEEEELHQPDNTPPPPPPVKASIQFTAPIIKADNEVSDDKMLKTDEEVKKNPNQVSFITQEGSSDPNAKDPEELLKHKEVTNTGTGTEEPPLKVAEVMPSFPGGNGELMKYLNSSIKYPTIAAENGIEGKVIVQFVVGRDGSITKVRAVKSIDPSLDKEAVRVVQNMPKWIPGKQNGRNVTVEYTLPVTFKLQK